jgi:succinate dehydrogenase / fumarate reductase, iron-sulfur subunit
MIRSSDQIPRLTLFKRFPVPRNLGAPPKSRIKSGRKWPAPSGARRVKTFEIYRYNPDSGATPRLGENEPLKFADGVKLLP